MKRVLLDTSVYGKLVEMGDSALVVANKRNVTLYGSVTVRHELRDTPKMMKVFYEGIPRKLRIVLLNLYDALVGDKTLPITFQVEELAEQYFVAYKKFGGSKSHEAIISDLTIVATATLSNLDVVYSNDKVTMFSESALKAYDFIGSIHGLSKPQFKPYEAFIANMKRGTL